MEGGEQMFKPIPEYEGYSINEQGTIKNRRGVIMSPEVRSYGKLSRIHINKTTYRDAVGNLVLRTFTGRTPTIKDRLVYADGNNLNPALNNVFHAPIKLICGIERELDEVIKELDKLNEML